jgi:hypothetical protein
MPFERAQMNGDTILGLVLFFVLVPLVWREAWFEYASRSWPTTAAKLHFVGVSLPGMSGNESSRARATLMWSMD